MPDFRTQHADDVIVLAIDPGNVDSAYVRLSGTGRILSFGKVPNKEMLEIAALPASFRVCEMIASYGMPVGRSVFDTCVFIGQLLERVAPEPVVLLPRLEEKLAICKSPKANDSTIRTALIDLYGQPGNKKAPGPTFGISGDVWAALAVGTTFLMGQYRPYVLSQPS